MTAPITAQAFAHQRGFEFLKDVDVRLSVELGRTDMKLKDVVGLGEDSIVMLDRLTDELLDILVNGKIIAKGEIVTHGNRFGLRIVEMADGRSVSEARNNDGRSVSEARNNDLRSVSEARNINDTPASPV